MKNRKILSLFLIILMGLSQPVFSSGFALIEQSVSAMGNAYAGGAASAEDASTVYFNPAGMTRICDYQLVSGGHIVVPYSKFKNKGSVLTSAVPAIYTTTGGTDVVVGGGGPLTGASGGNNGESALVGHTYFVKRCNNLAFGLGINSPFGLVTDYSGPWVGRYHADRSAVLTININPSVAYKFSDCFSVGVGFSAMYLHANLNNYVDYGTIAWLQAPSNAVRDGLVATGFLPQTQDGKVEIKGNSWGYGVNGGVLYEPCCGTRFGAHYRSDVKHKVRGTEKFSSLPALIENPALGGALAPFFGAIQASVASNTSARSSITLPGQASVSGYHEINNCWAVMGDVTWTHWEVLKRLVFNFDNPNQGPGITTLKWKNSFRYAGGITYKPDCKLTLRTGIAFDESPIPNKELRTPRLPGEDRLWLSLGAGYRVNCCLHFDFGYTHLVIREPKVDKSGFGEVEDIPRGGVRGNYDAYTDIISGQLVWDF